MDTECWVFTQCGLPQQAPPNDFASPGWPWVLFPLQWFAGERGVSVGKFWEGGDEGILEGHALIPRFYGVRHEHVDWMFDLLEGGHQDAWQGIDLIDSGPR